MGNRKYETLGSGEAEVLDQKVVHQDIVGWSDHVEEAT